MKIQLLVCYVMCDVTHQEVVWLNAEQFSEVAEGDRCVRLEAEVIVAVRRRQTASVSVSVHC